MKLNEITVFQKYNSIIRHDDIFLNEIMKNADI